jgi:hypothetical protein
MSELQKFYGYTAGVVACVFLALFFVSPMKQDLNYHKFIDRRTVLRVPNFGDVISNGAFAFTGLATIAVANGRLLPILLGISQILLCLGSGYYHWNPNNFGLGVDRISMSLVHAFVFLSLMDTRASLIVTPRFAAAWTLLCVLGTAYASWKDDLRFYVFGQYVPLVGILALLLFYSAKKPSSTLILAVAFSIVWFGKVFEAHDSLIYLQMGEVVSGHTIKHLVSAIPLALFAVWLKNV